MCSLGSVLKVMGASTKNKIHVAATTTTATTAQLQRRPTHWARASTSSMCERSLTQHNKTEAKVLRQNRIRHPKKCCAPSETRPCGVVFSTVTAVLTYWVFSELLYNDIVVVDACFDEHSLEKSVIVETG